tara:strand:+ start:1535 stop:2461 length:927 start_codon:yes stop_codon:yes gene_type:complete
MPDTASNIIVQTVGNTANIGTDYGTNGVNLATAHVPLQKLMFGNSGAAIRVSSSDPLPITVSGSDVAIVVSGNVGNCGEFGIGNFNNQYLKVAGSTSGAGITIQGTVSVTAGIAGIRITGGIIPGLSSARDTVGITGTVSLLDRDGTTGAAVKIYSGLTAIGVSGDALKVSLIDAGITATVTLSSIVGVTNATGPLKIEGNTNGIKVGITGDVSVTSISLPTAFTAGQKSIISTPGLSLPSFSMSSGAKIRALSTNTSAIYLGHTSNIGSTLGYPLLAGESCFLELNNLNLVYIVGGATGQTVTYFAS